MGLFGRRTRSAEQAEAVEVLERTGHAHLLRAPSVATRSIGWTNGGAPMPAEWDAANAIRLAYYANVYVWACVHAIATDVASLSFRVGPDPEKPQDFNIRDPLAQLLGPAPGGPNKVTSARRLWAWTVAQRLVTGRWAWEVELKGSQPAALWPLPSAHLTPLNSDGGDAYFSGFTYAVQGGQEKRLRPDQVLYDWVPSAHDWRQPESPLQAARLPISVAVMQERYDVAFLRNDARPAAVVVHEQFESTVGRDAWRRQFTDTHQGPDNAGKVAFVETTEDGAPPKDALFIQTVGLSQKDAEFVARYESTIRAIIVALGVPLSRLGDSSGRTFSNADRETLNYWHDTVLPITQEFAEAVNTHLAPRITSNVGWFDLSKIKALQDDKATPKIQPAPVHTYVREGLMTRNEGRAQLGLPPVPGGDELMDPAAMAALANVKSGAAAAKGGVAPADQTAKMVQDVALAVQKIYLGVPAVLSRNEARRLVSLLGVSLPDEPEPPPAPTPAQLAQPAALGELPPGNPSDGRSAVRAPLTAAEAKARREKLATQADARLRDLEVTWRRAFQRLLDRQRDAVLARLEGKRGRQMLRDMTETVAQVGKSVQRRDVALRVAEPSASQLFDRTFWESETETLAREMYSQVASVSGAVQATATGGDFALQDAWVQKLIRGRAQQLSPQVSGTTYDGIKDALAKGAQEGEGIPELADRIRGLFDQTYAARAETVARTEVVSAYNGVAHGFALESEEVAGLEWIATLDSRTRLSHAAMDGTIIRKGEAFNLDGAVLAFPGDPNVQAPQPGSVVINCRCTVAPVVREDMPPELLPS